MREDIRQLCSNALDLESIKTVVLALAKSIDAPVECLPSFANQMDGAHPNIELTESGFNYVIVERGEELRRSVTKDPFELLSWVFHDVTFPMAMKKVLRSRIAGQDFRRLLFQHQLELLGQLEENWRANLQRELAEILKNHPFDDLSSKRVDFCVQLRKQRVSDEEAWRKGCEKYPLPKLISDEN